MPGILFRHIFIELLKVLAVTTGVLVTVLAFAAAIKPLAEDLIGPADLLKYIAFATIPMLQFALPFAAAFAGTIVYHRLTSDNEIVAMAASGISYRRMLWPAVVLGLLLTVCMAVLVDVGVPKFWKSMKRIAARDMTKLLAANVERGEAFTPENGNMEIYADETHVTDAPGDTGAMSRLLLVGVVAITLDTTGNPLAEFTAQTATLDVHRVHENSYVKPVLARATVFNRGDNRIVMANVVRPEAVDLGRSFDEGPKGMTFTELWEVYDDVARVPQVAALRDNLLAALVAIDAWKCITDAVDGKRTFTLRGSGEAERTEYEVVGGGIDGSRLLPRSDGTVLVRQYLRAADARVLRSEITAPQLTLTLASAGADGSARFDLVAEGATIRDARGDGTTRGDRSKGSFASEVEGGVQGGLQRGVHLAELALINCPVPDRATIPMDELIAQTRVIAASVDVGPADELGLHATNCANGLEARIKVLRNEVIARVVQRVAQAMTALLMLLTGSVLAILLRHRAPLFVYLLAFLPAIIDLIVISGGEQMLKGGFSPTAVLVAMSGNIALFGVCLFTALRVRKH